MVLQHPLKYGGVQRQGDDWTVILIALLSSTIKCWRNVARERQIVPDALISGTSALLFAYIDDRLSRIDLPKKYAIEAFSFYKSVVIETFNACEFSIEVSKCFPSGRFVIFLNEVYLVDLHVVHGVRATMGISIEPTERHTSLIERVTSVATRCRGAVPTPTNGPKKIVIIIHHDILELFIIVFEFLVHYHI